MQNALGNIVAVLVSIVGLAMVAVLVSRNANTAGVIRETGNAVSGLIATAVSPVASSNRFGIGAP